MIFWTAHLRSEAEPVVIPERFAWGGLVFGPFWLALHRAWVPAVIVLALDVLIGALAPSPADIVLECGLALLVGLLGHDLRRWNLQARGYLQTHVLAARDESDALGRVLALRPDQARHFMPARAAR